MEEKIFWINFYARFTSLRDEVDEENLRDITVGEDRSRRGLRIGASCAGSVPDNFFQGYIANMSVYPACLSPDRVLAHYLAGAQDRSKDAQRLYAVASSRYEDALTFAPVSSTMFCFFLFHYTI